MQTQDPVKRQPEAAFCKPGRAALGEVCPADALTSDVQPPQPREVPALGGARSVAFRHAALADCTHGPGRRRLRPAGTELVWLQQGRRGR